MLLVTEDLHVTDTTLLPCLVAGALVEECLVVNKQLGTDGMKDLLFFFSRLDLDLLELDL